MVDISANNGWLGNTLKTIHLIQMLVQGQWIYEPDLFTIPHINKANYQALIKELRQLDKLKNVPVDTLSGLKYATMSHRNLIESSLYNIHESKMVDSIIKHLQILPWIHCKFSIFNPESNNRINIDFSSSKSVELTAATEYEFVFSFNRKSSSDKLNVNSKKFPKTKDESWFICIACGDELVAIKRLVIRKKTSTTFNLTSPSLLGNFAYTLYILSDSYLGLDQQYVVPFQIKN